MTTVWKTKYGSRRVRHDPPTLEEAIAAAQGLTDDVAQQVEIAASLMDVPADEVRSRMPKPMTPRKIINAVAVTTRDGHNRSVVVERKSVRRVTPTTQTRKRVG